MASYTLRADRRLLVHGPTWRRFLVFAGGIGGLNLLLCGPLAWLDGVSAKTLVLFLPTLLIVPALALAQRRARFLEVGPDGIRVRAGRRVVANDPRGRVLRVRRSHEEQARRSSDSGVVIVEAVDLLLEGTGLPERFRVPSGPTPDRVAREIALHLGVDLEDAVGDEVQIRPVSTLGAPVGAGPPAAGPPPRRIEVERGPVPELRIRGVYLPDLLAGVLAVLGLVVLGVTGLYALAGESLRAQVVGALLLACCAGLGFAFAALTVGCERVRVEPDAIVVDRWFLGRAWHQRSVPRAALEALRVQTRIRGRRGLELVNAAAPVRLGRPLDEAGLAWLRDWIRHALGTAATA